MSCIHLTVSRVDEPLVGAMLRDLAPHARIRRLRREPEAITLQVTGAAPRVLDRLVQALADVERARLHLARAWALAPDPAAIPPDER
jgi:ABC-type antimicrobial peptide transport system ATPase subunit